MVSGARGLVGTYAHPVVAEELSGEPGHVREGPMVERTVREQGMNRINAAHSRVQVKFT